MCRHRFSRGCWLESTLAGPHQQGGKREGKVHTMRFERGADWDMTPRAIDRALRRHEDPPVPGGAQRTDYETAVHKAQKILDEYPGHSLTDDALFLQLKEADASVLERYTHSDLFKHQGARVVFGQRLMQASSDTFLGYASASAGGKQMDFYVRQLNDFKTSADVSGMSEGRLGLYVEVCAEALAREVKGAKLMGAVQMLPGEGESTFRIISWAAAFPSFVTARV